MPLPVILNTVAGHLFGYYAACSIDEEALFLREFKGRLNLVMVEHARQNLNLYESIADDRLRRLVGDFADRFHRRRNQGAFTLTGTRTHFRSDSAAEIRGRKTPAGRFPA